MPARKTERHLTPEELSERLGGRYPVATLKKWRATGKGPRFIRPGKYVLYPESEVEAWERAQLAATT